MNFKFIDGKILAQKFIASLPSSAPFSSDLEELQNILHFPEEVALRLTDAEFQLYYQVSENFSFNSNQISNFGYQKKFDEYSS